MKKNDIDKIYFYKLQFTSNKVEKGEDQYVK